MLADVFKIVATVGVGAAILGVAAPRIATRLVADAHQGVTAAPQAPAAPPPRPAPIAAPPTTPSVSSFGRAEIVADRSGHFRADVDVEGRRLPMLVDTGATFVSLSYDDALALGALPTVSAFTIPMQTANGRSFAAPLRLRDVRIGGVEVRDVEAVVMPRGATQSSLLGMSFLQRLGGFRVDHGRLVLNP